MIVEFLGIRLVAGVGEDFGISGRLVARVLKGGVLVSFTLTLKPMMGFMERG